MRRFLISVLLTLLIALASVASADTITTKDGKKLEGRITEQTDEYVRLRTGYGDLTIPRSDIDSISLSATKVHLKDGRVMEGMITEETSDTLTLRTKYGELKIPRGDIEKIDRPQEYIAKGEKKTPGPQKKEEPARKLTPQEIQQMHSRAIKLLQDGNYDESIELYKQIIAGGPDDPRVSIAYYNLACAYSLKGSKDEALDALEASIENGYTDFAHMERDTDLDNVRNESRYKSLLARREEIQKRGAEKRVEELKKLFKDQYKFSQECMFEIDEERKIIYATNQSAAVLQQLKEALNEYADVQWKLLFDNKPTYYITIVCPSDVDFRKMVPNRGVGGYYNHQGKILVCGGIGMVLRHEFTHALHFGDLSARGYSHPIWLIEGLSTCFEESALIDGVPTPLPNGRLNVVRIALATNKYISWDNFFKYSQRQYMGNASVCYAESRYITYYFWQLGKLKEFYDAFCETFEEDKTGKTAVEKVFGKPLAQVEADFKEWIANAPEPVGATPQGAPFFGVGTQGTAAGMQVVQIVPGSSADKAGIKVDDIIIEFAGKKYTNRDQFATAIREQKTGETIKVKLLRGEETIELDVKLEPRE